MPDYVNYSQEELRYYNYVKEPGTKGKIHIHEIKLMIEFVVRPFSLTRKMLREGHFFTNGSHLLIWVPVTELNAAICRVFSLADGVHINDFVTEGDCFPNMFLGERSLPIHFG